MKICKKIFPHILAFIIFGLLYLIPLILLWNNWYGYIFYVVLFVLIELIYHFANKKTKLLIKTRNKVFLIVLSLVVLLILFGILFCTIDYIMAKNGKKPIFSEFKVSWSGYSNIDETDATVYVGLGYKIAVCNICEKSVYILPFGIGNYPIQYLTCISKQENYEDSYTFVDGKLDTLDQVQTISDIDESAEESQKEYIKEINNTLGCSGGLTKESIGSYKIWKRCTLSKMSNVDIENIYGVNKDKFNLSITEIIKQLKNSDATIKCELKKY